MRIPHDEFLALDLEVHDFLRGIPLRDVSAIDLPAASPGRTIADVRALLEGDRMAADGATRFLFRLRTVLGEVFGWDRESKGDRERSYIRRLRDDQRARSLVAPGATNGPFVLVYLFPAESLEEVRNATVHAFSCMVLRPRPAGYRFYWAIYVEPVSWLTPVYMAMIEPFRRYIVYPAILRHLREAWAE